MTDAEHKAWLLKQASELDERAAQLNWLARSEIDSAHACQKAAEKLRDEAAAIDAVTVTALDSDNAPVQVPSPFRKPVVLALKTEGLGLRLAQALSKGERQ